VATLVRFDPLGGDSRELAIDHDRWTDADVAVDDVLDLRGLVAVRGLVDAHAHLGADGITDLFARVDQPDRIRARAFAHLSSGVFLVIDKGHRDDTVLRFAADAPPPLPHLSLAGRILHPPGGYYEGWAEEVDPADLPRAVAEAAAGASWVKLVGDWPKPGVGPTPNWSPDDLAVAVAVAHEAGCRVAIHTAAPDTPAQAVAAGVDSIEHGLFLDGDDLAALGARGGIWVPTLHAMAAVRDGLRPGSRGERLLGDGLDNAAARLPEARAAGVTVLCGTDLSLPHGDVAVEALTLVRAGLSPAAAVEAVATAGWSVAGLAALPEPGDPADLVAFAADPTERPDTLLHPVVALRGGTVLLDRR
jgi:imidazolonepropionase-like amidohydrolase